MPRVSTKDIEQRLKDIEEFLLDDYKEMRKGEKKKRDWRTYEQRYARRVKLAIRNMEPLIKEACSFEIHKENGSKGRNPALKLDQKVTLLLLKQLLSRSNRNMSSMLDIFSLLSGIDVSYKTVERLYSDPEVELAIHNLHVLILRKKGVKSIDASGDGTGYSLTVKRHYASISAKRKQKAKKQVGKRRIFAYSFAMMDLTTGMYVCYGTSLRSEKQAFSRAMEMLASIGIEIRSIRLDKYYSLPSYADMFGDAKIYVIPRKNSTMKGSWKWKRTMREFVLDTIPYLREYYKRNNSESGFSADKKLSGWKVNQRRGDRINTAIVCKHIWRNLLNLYIN